MTSDVDLRIHLAFLLYALTGFYVAPPTSYAAILFWCLLTLALFGNVQIGFNTMRINELLVKLDAALKERLIR